MELRAGQRISRRRTITLEDVRRFAELSGDRGRHHLETDERGRLLAHGLLTATLPTEIGGSVDFMAREMRFEFLKPVYSGDTITCDGEVLEVKERSRMYWVTFGFTVANQDGATVLEGTARGVILKPAGGPQGSR